MPLPLPNLDDRSYADLLDEARALITTYAPEWTNHNPSDPGIALVELFAWLSEILIYRANQIPDTSYWAFLRLLSGPKAPLPTALDAAISQTIRDLREPFRAVTATDYEHLAAVTWPATEAAQRLGLRRLRVRCLFEHDLTFPNPQFHDDLVPGHISLVVVPEPPLAGKEEQLHAVLGSFLHERRVLTTRLHIVSPGSVPVTVRATLHPRADAVPDEVERAAREALRTFYDPLCGGADGDGWPFGRALYASELYARLDGLPGIDYVEGVTLERGGSGAGGAPIGAGKLAQITLRPHELPKVPLVHLNEVVCAPAPAGGAL